MKQSLSDCTEERDILASLKEAIDRFGNFDFKQYTSLLTAARNAIADRGDPPSLLGEWLLALTFSEVSDLEKTILYLEHAWSLLEGRSRVVSRGTSMILNSCDPFTIFWREPGKAEVSGLRLEEAERLWYRLTGGGRGLALLYQSRLAYFQGRLNEAWRMAGEAFRMAKEYHQPMNGICAAETLGLLIRHNFSGPDGDSALRYLRHICEGEEQADKKCVQQAMISRGNIYLSMGILKELPEWIITGDFGAVSDSQPPGWRMIEEKLTPSLLPGAMVSRIQYLTYSGRYGDALNTADTAERVFGIRYPLTNLYFDQYRSKCYGWFVKDGNRQIEYLRRMLNGCAPDGLWLVPGECELSLELVEKLAQAYGPEAVTRIREVGDGLKDRIIFLREAYFRDHLPENLTRREQEVIELVGQGCTNAQAARELGISEETVKSHLKHAFDKLQVSSRRELTEAMRNTRKAVTAVWPD